MRSVYPTEATTSLTLGVSVLAQQTQEVLMTKTNTNPSAALKMPKQLLVSFIVTMWAIGTSAAAGALSA